MGTFVTFVTYCLIYQDDEISVINMCVCVREREERDLEARAKRNFEFVLCAPN